MAIRVSGMVSGLDTDALVRDLTSAYRSKGDKYVKQQKTLEMQKDVWKEINKKVYNFYTGSLNTARLESGYGSKEFKSNNENVIDKVSGNGEADIKVTQLATKSYMTGGEIKDEDWPLGQDFSFEIKIAGRTHNIDLTADMMPDDVAKKLSDVGLEANFDKHTHRLFLASKTAGAASSFEITGDETMLNKLGLGSTAAYSQGTNAVAYINGAKFEQDSNNFEVNGMKFRAVGQGTAALKETSTGDAKSTIKKFVEDYNNLIKELNTRYTAKKSGLDPLTEDEEEAMTDRQVEKWNEKLNEGILGKDQTLGSIINTLQGSMLSSVKIGDKNYSLSALGIKRDGYNTNELTIDEKKLDQFLAQDERLGIDIVKGIAQTTYEKLGNKMKSTNMRSAYTIYNDKQIDKDIEALKKRQISWEDKVTAIEDKYYKQFAAMEKAMSQLQGNSNALLGLFG